MHQGNPFVSVACVLQLDPNKGSSLALPAWWSLLPGCSIHMALYRMYLAFLSRICETSNFIPSLSIISTASHAGVILKVTIRGNHSPVATQYPNWRQYISTQSSKVNSAFSVLSSNDQSWPFTFIILGGGKCLLFLLYNFLCQSRG